MNIEPSIIVAVLALSGAGVNSYFVWRASSKATSVESRKVDQEAYDRAVALYQKQLDDSTRQIDRMTGQMDRLNTQLDKVSTQLSSEQDISRTLRSQMKSLQVQVEVMKQTIAALRERLDVSNGKLD